VSSAMASIVPKEKPSFLSRVRNNLRLTSTGQGTSTAASGPSQAIPPVATGEGFAPPAANVNSTPKEPQPRQKFGLFLLTPDLRDDQLDPQLPDIVAIHGINGDPYETWRHENGRLWLRDFLPKHIPRVRVFSFGYDAQVAFTTSTADLQSFAKSLLGHLGRYRTGKEQPPRPLIFICHSMGGIVLKEAVVLAQIHPEKYPFIKDSIKGILFLSTPHRGSESVEWPQLLAKILNASLYLTAGLHGSARTDLLKSLERNSKELRGISDNFSSQVKCIKIISCYEQNKTTVGRALLSLIVDENTGVLGWPGEIQHPMMGCDHHTVCRFSDEDDQRYLIILHEIQTMLGQ